MLRTYLTALPGQHGQKLRLEALDRHFGVWRAELQLQGIVRVGTGVGIGHYAITTIFPAWARAIAQQKYPATAPFRVILLTH